MRYVEDERLKTIYGDAKVKVLAKTLRVSLLGALNKKTGKRKILDEYTFDKEEVNCAYRSGTFQVAISGDGNILFGMYPPNGTFLVKFDRFVSARDQPPAPRREQGTRTGGDGTVYPYDDLTFRAVVEIQEGDDKGMEIPIKLFYDKFIEDEDGYVAVKKGKSRSEFLGAFLEATGVWDMMFEYSENILPELEDTIRSKRKKFIVVMKGGWAQSVAPALSIGRQVRKSKSTKKKTTKKK